jgi:CubicO group peptidase (beta-lactamase class C family)
MLLALLPVVARADDRIAKIEDYFAGQAAEGGLNGNVLVAEKGRIVFMRSYGFADFEAKRPNTADTEFEMASIGKLFTATAVLQLVERGKVGLDAPLARYLPDFPYKTITVRQLLSHSSGLAEQDAALRRYEVGLGRPLEMADIAPAIAADNTPMRRKPGEKWWYSNLGYQLLARLVEVRSGLAFPVYLQHKILGPAGLRHTYLKTATINNADTPLFARNYDYPFRYSSRRVRLEGEGGYYRNRLYGNSNIVSTTGDMLRFDRALRDHRLLRENTLAAAYTPQKLADGAPVFVWSNIGGMGDADDGLGWFVFRNKDDGRTVWHAGGMRGCVTMFMRNLDKDQTIIVFDNTGSEALYKKALSAMRILNGHPPIATPRALARIYGRALMDEGEDTALVTLLQHRGDPEHYALSEDELNNLGYQFAEQGHVPHALATFRVAILL